MRRLLIVLLLAGCSSSGGDACRRDEPVSARQKLIREDLKTAELEPAKHECPTAEADDEAPCALVERGRKALEKRPSRAVHLCTRGLEALRTLGTTAKHPYETYA